MPVTRAIHMIKERDHHARIRYAVEDMLKYVEDPEYLAVIFTDNPRHYVLKDMLHLIPDSVPVQVNSRYNRITFSSGAKVCLVDSTNNPSGSICGLEITSEYYLAGSTTTAEDLIYAYTRLRSRASSHIPRNLMVLYDEYDFNEDGYLEFLEYAVKDTLSRFNRNYYDSLILKEGCGYE